MKRPCNDESRGIVSFVREEQLLNPYHGMEYLFIGVGVGVGNTELRGERISAICSPQHFKARDSFGAARVLTAPHFRQIHRPFQQADSQAPSPPVYGRNPNQGESVAISLRADRGLQPASNSTRPSGLCSKTICTHSLYSVFLGLMEPVWRTLSSAVTMCWYAFTPGEFSDDH
jgi:hypothetical protein